MQKTQNSSFWLIAGMAGILGACDDGSSAGAASPARTDAGSDANASNPEASTADDGSTGCVGVPIVPDATGLIGASSNSVGITGSWYSYVDCNDYLYFDSGVPDPGKNCSLLSTPASGSFKPADGTQARMCTSGTTLQVMPSDDWKTHWGAGIGLDLNNPSGTKLDFNATAAGVTGFCFMVTGNTIPPMKVNLPTDQGITDNWYYEVVSTPGVHKILFTDQFLQTTPTPATPFDPSKLQSIQFQIAATTSAAVPWDFCIDQLTAIQ
jgi:hypothetical protein